jgi:hypothetical protein
MNDNAPIVARSLAGGAAALAQRAFPGEGIMIEVIFARGNDPAQVGTCRRRDLATILADSLALL